MTAAREFIRGLLHRLGVEIVRYPGRLPGHTRVKLLNHHGVDLVLDVGANDGGYARDLRRFGYGGRLVSFEPLREPFDRLVLSSSGDPGWVAVQAAVGDQAGRVTMNVACNSTSSSILSMLEAHRQSAPTSKYVAVEEVSVVRLDDEWSKHVPAAAVPFLKVDTQGFERQVLEGARNTLPRLRGVQLEMSLVPLYQGSMLFEEAWKCLLAAGFELQSLEPGFTDPATGRLLQVDGIFFRSD